MKKNNIPFIIVALIWLLSMIFPLFTGIRSTIRNGDRVSGNIVGIDDTAFFNDLPGVFYVYFGRPTCPDCVEFEPLLEKELQNNHWTVYYFDTAYWKDDAQYERILQKYHVDAVPSLVRIINGDFDSGYQYGAEEGEAAALNELARFMFPKYSGLSDTASDGHSAYPGFPVQFHNRLAAITFFGMLLNAIYLLTRVRNRKAEISGSHVLMVAVNASVLMILHWLIVRLGFSFALQYNAEPDQTILGIIGTSTWMQGTPVLYAGILLLCAYLATKIKRKENKAEAEE